MKRTADNFTSDYGNTLNLGIVSGDNLHASTHFLTLPEDVILGIFANFSESILRQLSLVSTAFNILAKKDILWQNIAESILFPHEMKAKPEKKTYKEYCKEWLSPTKIGPLKIIPRDSDFIQRIKHLELPNFQILSPTEMQDLVKQKSTTKLIQAIWLDNSTHNKTLHHIAQQQVGETKFDFFNNTPNVVSFDSNRHMLINNKLTSKIFSPDDCQLFILMSGDNFYIYISDIGNNSIILICCPVDALTKDDLTKITWEGKALSKSPDPDYFHLARIHATYWTPDFF